MRVIFIVPYPIEGPSSRLRVWQYLRHLENLGIKCSFRPFMSSAFYKVVYQPGHLPTKIYHLLICTLKRILDLFRSKSHDLVFVQREAFPLGPPIFEWIVARILKKPLVYDFDDAIFLRAKSRYNNLIQFLKSPKKVSRIIQISRHVIVGNDYLQEYALKYNRYVSVIPTPVDIDRFRLEGRKINSRNVVVGWMGSHSTSKFLLPLKETFQKLQKRYPHLIIRFVGAENFLDQFPFAQFREWELEREPEELDDFDVGIMPMPDDEWSKGKCGYKLLQYMATGIPVVCSPIGVNSRIVQEGENGSFAATPEEWFQKLSELVENSEKRTGMGLKGRRLVENGYSLQVCLPRLYEVLERHIKSACTKR